MATKPTPKPKFKKAMPAPGSGNDPVTKALKFFLGDQTKPSKKKTAPKTPGVKVRGTPVPLAEYKPYRAPGAPKPVPMPKRVPNLNLPPDQRTKAKPARPGLKKKSLEFKFSAPKRKK